MLKYFKITGCDELTSLLQNDNRKMQPGIRSSQFHFVQELVSLQRLHIIGCSNLISFPEVGLPPFLKHLKIESCNSLEYFTRYHIPLSLRRIEIGDCLNLKSLVEGEGSSSSFSSGLMHEEESCLEYLKIWECPSLTSLFERGQLPRELEQLYVWDCQQLESITDKFQDNTCLQCVHIRRCPNLKSLPEGLCHLTHLQMLYIFQCGSLESFPEGGLPKTASNLTTICIWDLKSVTLPEGMDKHNLSSLQKLTIAYCEGLVSILEKGFPLNLTVLKIVDPKGCKPLSQWGLQLNKLTSLKELWISGVDPDLVSFPPEDIELMLPKSLIRLDIASFPSLRRLSRKALQVLTSLEYLEIADCQKLESIPEKDLPLSLAKLHIYACPLLKYRYTGKTIYWFKISHIPCVHIGDKYLNPQETHR